MRMISTSTAPLWPNTTGMYGSGTAMLIVVLALMMPPISVGAAKPTLPAPGGAMDGRPPGKGKKGSGRKVQV